MEKIETIDDLTADLAKEILDNAKPKRYKVYRKYMDGDHWQGGDGWVGPKPDIAELEGTENASQIISDFSTRLSRQFVSKNVIKEVVSRHINGVLSREVDVQFIQKEGEPDPESEEIIEREKAIRLWMEEKDALKQMRKALEEALVGEHSVIRLFIPSGVANEDGILETPETLEEALNYVNIEALNPEEATVYTDPETMREYGVYSYTDDNDDEFTEISYYNPEDKLTYVRVLGGETDQDEGEGYTLHGRLTMFQIERDALITEQIKQNQDLLNKNLTMWSANLDWSGFTERMILNGMPPGQWNHDTVTGEMEYEEKGDLVTGPSRTNYVFGQPIWGEDGKVRGFTDPQVMFREPIDVETFDKTLGSCYTSILEEAKQSHVLLNSDETPSGISRREARQDYQDDLKSSKQNMDKAGRWVIETVIKLGYDILGQASDEEEYRGSFNCTLQLGALTSDEMDMLSKQVENKLISVETAMRRMGIDDVEAELERIDSVSEHMKEIIETLTEMGVSSATLNTIIVKLLLVDKAPIFGDAVGEGEISTIQTEIEQSTNANAQQSAFISGLGTDEPDEDEEEIEEEDA